MANLSAEGAGQVKLERSAGQNDPPLVAHVFPTFAVGGAQMRFAAIANHFGQAFRHIVVSLDGNAACRDFLRADLDVTFPTVAAPKNAMFANARRYRRLLQAWRPDVLVTCNWGAIEFALANLLPVTRHLHMVDGFGPEERSARIPRRVLIRRLALGRTPVVLPSRSLVRIAGDVWKLPQRMIRYVPNGIDLGRFAAAAAGTQRGAGETVIGTVAALRPEKNVARLLRAAAPLSGCRLVIVGDGPERASLTDLGRALGMADRVTFAGYRQDTPDFYARFDLFVLSSDTEQMPLSVIEAMASGLPVVSTDVGDVRLMVSAENAAFIVPMDDGALGAALSALAGNAELRRRIGGANLAKSRRDFDQAAMFAAHGALWRGSAAAP